MKTNDPSYNDEEIRKCTGHKSFPVFRKRMKDTGKAADAVCESAWISLMNGFAKQPGINDCADKIAVTLKGLASDSLTDAIRSTADAKVFKDGRILVPQVRQVFERQLCISGKDDDKIRLLTNLLKSANPDYIEFVKQMEEYLKIENGKELALWSGGVDLSDFAYKQGGCCQACDDNKSASKCTPLERTVAGSILNELPVHSNWKLEAPLWNILSQGFVAINKKINVVHVFFRVVTMTSVLLRQEVPLFKVLNPNCIMHWHPVVNAKQNISEIAEIGRNGDLISYSGSGFTSLRDSLEKLVNAIKKGAPGINREALGNMYIMGLNVSLLGMAPFGNSQQTDWNKVGAYEKAILDEYSPV